MTKTITLIATIEARDDELLDTIRTAFEKVQIGQKITIDELYTNDPPPELSDQSTVGSVRISNRRMYRERGR